MKNELKTFIVFAMLPRYYIDITLHNTHMLRKRHIKCLSSALGQTNDNTKVSN